MGHSKQRDSSAGASAKTAGGARVAGRVASCARRHRLAVLLLVLALSAACFQLVPGDTLVASVGQTALLALLALGAVAVVDPRVVCGPRTSCGGSPAPSLRFGWGWTAFVLAIGLAGGAATCALAGFSLAGIDPASLAARLGGVVALCLLTGVFEEGVFRALAIDAFAPAFGGANAGLLGAAAASSVLFGLLHLSAGDVSLAGASAIAWAQFALKPVQAGLFGFFMAARFLSTRNLWAAALVHGAFNVLYVGPTLFFGGMAQTYVTGSALDVLPLAVTAVLLLAPAAAAYRFLVRARG